MKLTDTRILVVVSGLMFAPGIYQTMAKYRNPVITKRPMTESEKALAVKEWSKKWRNQYVMKDSNNQ